MSLRFGTSAFSPISMFTNLGTTPSMALDPSPPSAPLTHGDGCRRTVCDRRVGATAVSCGFWTGPPRRLPG